LKENLFLLVERRGNFFCLFVKQHNPVIRNNDSEVHFELQVRLIEDWEDAMCVKRHAKLENILLIVDIIETMQTISVFVVLTGKLKS
jgi:hypothetical protein